MLSFFFKTHKNPSFYAGAMQEDLNPSYSIFQLSKIILVDTLKFINFSGEAWNNSYTDTF
jgi:hypothetical protein